jgi:hypothetical protein
MHTFSLLLSVQFKYVEVHFLEKVWISKTPVMIVLRGNVGVTYFTMKILIEKHREFNMETHIAFVDFKKAFDRINRKELLRILASDQVPQQTI